MRPRFGAACRPLIQSFSAQTPGPRSSGDRAPPSGGGSAGSNPAGGASKTPGQSLMILISGLNAQGYDGISTGVGGHVSGPEACFTPTASSGADDEVSVSSDQHDPEVRGAGDPHPPKASDLPSRLGQRHRRMRAGRGRHLPFGRGVQHHQQSVQHLCWHQAHLRGLARGDPRAAALIQERVLAAAAGERRLTCRVSPNTRDARNPWESRRRRPGLIRRTTSDARAMSQAQGCEMRGGPPGGDRGIPLPGTDVRRGTDGVRSIAPSATARAQRGVARVACGVGSKFGGIFVPTRMILGPRHPRQQPDQCPLRAMSSTGQPPRGSPLDRAYPSGRPGVGATGRLLRFSHPVRAERARHAGPRFGRGDFSAASDSPR